MNPMLSAWLGAALRALLGPALMWVAIRIGFDKGDAELATLALSGVVLNLLWVLWVKYRDRLKFLTALESPNYYTEASVAARVKADPPSVWVTK